MQWIGCVEQGFEVRVPFPNLRGEPTAGYDDAGIRQALLDRFHQRRCVHHGAQRCLVLRKKQIVRRLL